MRTLRLAACAALIAASLSGCATDGLTTMTWGGESQLRTQTVYATGIPLGLLAISELAQTGISQSGYIATNTQTGERWSCTRNGGILYSGVAEAPSCIKL